MILLGILKERLYKIKLLFNYKVQKKRKAVKKNADKYRKEIVEQLKESGYFNIKNYSLSTWKYYGIDSVRLTFIAKKAGSDKRYIIKVTKGFEDKVNNSIKFQKRFNDEFSFIPKGDEIKLNDYVGYATEYIPSYSFSLAKYYIDKSNVNYYLNQVNSILDELSRYKIVHCDLEQVNILVSKEDKKIYLIDWDTCCSEMLGFSCQHFPGYTIKRKTENNKFIYDDAFSFYTLFNRLGIDGLDELEPFIELKKKINENIHVADE